jgi:hypothetical protein
MKGNDVNVIRKNDLFADAIVIVCFNVHTAKVIWVVGNITFINLIRP